MVGSTHWWSFTRRGGTWGVDQGMLDDEVSKTLHNQPHQPYSGHCKKLVPEYTALGEAVSKDPALASRVVIGKVPRVAAAQSTVSTTITTSDRVQHVPTQTQVDADKHRELGTRFGVSGFPTLKWFTRGQKTTVTEEYAS